MSDKTQPDDNTKTNQNPKESANKTQDGLTASITLSEPKSNKKTSTQAASPKQEAKSTSPQKSAKPVKQTAKPASEIKLKNKISKTAIIALLIGLIAIAASAAHFYWAQQQNITFQQLLNQTLLNQQKVSQQKLTQQLQSQQQKFTQQIKLLEAGLTAAQITQIEQLQQQLGRLQQNNPSDWLLHETEYLIRVAARSLWLEQDTGTAITLLQDATLRILELNDPQYLSLREAIEQDITRLQLLPKRNTEQVILKLMALEQQLNHLTFPKLEIPESQASKDELALTESIDDWQGNLLKSIDKFFGNFFTINREGVNTRPLISPEYKQNLRENLSLKIQTAIWAARKQNTDIYRQSLTEATVWINKYFDMSSEINLNFSQAIEQLSSNLITVDYPTNLGSLSLVRQALTQKNRSMPIPKQEKQINEKSEEINTIDHKNTDESLTELTQEEGA